jgi:hypothetical protein
MTLNADVFKYIILTVLIMILLSLATALYHLTAGKGDSGKMLKALTWRIALSVALLMFLALAGHMGWFTPHDFGRPPVNAAVTQQPTEHPTDPKADHSNQTTDTPSNPKTDTVQTTKPN